MTAPLSRSREYAGEASRKGAPAFDKDFVLSAIRIAVLRCRMDETELNSIGVALRGDKISPDEGMLWLQEMGLIGQALDHDDEDDLAAVREWWGRRHG